MTPTQTAQVEAAAQAIRNVQRAQGVAKGSYQLATAALTAAREVTPLIWDEQKVRAEERERCAQVLIDNWDYGDSPSCTEMVKRIRALKDEP